MSVIFIDKTDSQNREKRENYWIHNLKTMVPWDLNIRNSVSATLFSFTVLLGHGKFKDKIYGHITQLLSLYIYIYIYIYFVRNITKGETVGDDPPSMILNWTLIFS